jgi:hypothetical protein
MHHGAGNADLEVFEIDITPPASSPRRSPVIASSMTKTRSRSASSASNA